MTNEEKIAIQTVLIDELAQEQQRHPTMLIDAILANQGFQLIQMVLQRRLAYASGVEQAMKVLIRAMRNGGAEPALPPEVE